MKKILITIFFVSIAFFVNAYSFKVDGLCYQKNSDGTSVKVTYEKTTTWGTPNGYYDLSGDVVIPETVTYDGVSYSVTSIGDYAFGSCSDLTSVTIPNSVTCIGTYAFQDCTGLMLLTIPHSVTSIADDAFYDCSEMNSIIVENGNPVYDSRDNCNAIIETATNTLFLGCKNTIIPNSVTKIGQRAFLCCSGLSSISIPNSVIEIGSRAFSNCHNLTYIVIPNSVIAIDSYAFLNCTSLSYVSL